MRSAMAQFLRGRQRVLKKGGNWSEGSSGWRDIPCCARELSLCAARQQVAFSNIMLEMFVEDLEDDMDVIDIHLRPQLDFLFSHHSNTTSPVTMNRFDRTFDASNLTNELNHWANFSNNNVEKSRTRTRRTSSNHLLNVTALPDRTVQKICRLYARDFVV